MSLRQTAAALLLAALAVLAVAGCTASGSGEEDAGVGTAGGAGAATTPGSAAVPATAGPGERDPGASPPGATGPREAVAGQAGGQAMPDATVLVDGRHSAILLSVDAVTRTARFDLVQFLTGDAANRAAAEDGRETPVPNGYYTRNEGDRLRTLPVAEDATISVNALAAGEAGPDGGDVRYTLAKLASRMVPGDRPIFWLTVRGDRIVGMEQQYLP